MVVINNEAIKEIAYQIESEGNPANAGEYIYDYINNKNPHENLTFALRSIKEDLKEILSHYPESFYFGQVHFNLLYEVFKELEWNIDFSNIDVNGWQYDVFVPIEVPNKEFYYELSCSWYNPYNYLEKRYIKK